MYVLNAQAPQKMTYQAVIRNNSNSLLVNQSVGMRISILRDSINGTSIYEESHKPSTNANGLASLIIGNGSVTKGKFDTINWSKGPFFIKTETDPTGGVNYNIISVSQLLSVPYALYAERSMHADTAQFALSVQGGSSSLSFPKNQSIEIAVTNQWKELDLSPFIGKNRAIVKMRFINLANWTGVITYFRSKGDTIEYKNSFSDGTANVGSNGSAIVNVVTNEFGVLEYKGYDNLVIGVRLEIFMVLK